MPTLGVLWIETVVNLLRGLAKKDKDMGHVWQTKPTFWQRNRAIIITLVVALLLASGGGLLWRAAHSWSWYSDSTGHFRIPVAPGWTTYGFYNGPLQYPDCSYSVIMNPPWVVPPYNPVDAPRLLMITTEFPCSYDQQLSQNLFTNPLPTPVTINGKRTTLYDTGQAGVGRLAVATFGSNQYQFLLDDSQPTSAAKGDLAIFIRIIAGFQYTGKG